MGLQVSECQQSHAQCLRKHHVVCVWYPILPKGGGAIESCKVKHIPLGTREREREWWVWAEVCSDKYLKAKSCRAVVESCCVWFLMELDVMSDRDGYGLWRERGNDVIQRLEWCYLSASASAAPTPIYYLPSSSRLSFSTPHPDFSILSFRGTTPPTQHFLSFISHLLSLSLLTSLTYPSLQVLSISSTVDVRSWDRWGPRSTTQGAEPGSPFHGQNPLQFKSWIFNN